LKPVLKPGKFYLGRNSESCSPQQKERMENMSPIFDRITFLTIKLERYISMATLFSLALFLIRIASPDIEGGTGK